MHILWCLGFRFGKTVYDYDFRFRLSWKGFSNFLSWWNCHHHIHSNWVMLYLKCAILLIIQCRLKVLADYYGLKTQIYVQIHSRLSSYADSYFNGLPLHPPYKVHIVLVLYITMIQLISDVPYYWRSSMKWIFLNIDKLDYSLIIYTVDWELTY